MAKRKRQAETFPEVLSIAEASRFLGVHVNTLYKHANAGNIPCRKLGGRWLFSKRALESWLVNQQKESKK